jgi:hypothetical protein
VPRRLANVTLDNLDDLPHKCRRCVFWELDPVSHSRAQAAGDPALEKEAWISSTLLEWGSCGKIAYVDGVPAGYVLYAPPLYVPRSVAFPTSPVSGDAVLLMTAGILDEFTGGGLGRMLVQGVAKDLTRRGGVQDGPPAPPLPAAAAGAQIDRVVAGGRRGGAGAAAGLDDPGTGAAHGLSSARPDPGSPGPARLPGPAAQAVR